MTDKPTPSPSSTSASSKPGKAADPLKPWLEIGPVIIFVIVYFWLRRSLESEAIYPAAIIFTGFAVLAMIISRLRSGAWSKMLLLTTAIIVISTGLAYIFKNPAFFYMKPTVINIALGIGVIGGVMMKKNVIKLLFGDAFELPTKIWNQLAIRYGLFFFALAALNEIVWRNLSEPTWVKFKLFGLIPLTFIFAIAQTPLIMKHGGLSREGNSNKDAS